MGKSFGLYIALYVQVKVTLFSVQWTREIFRCLPSLPSGNGRARGEDDTDCNRMAVVKRAAADNDAAVEAGLADFIASASWLVASWDEVTPKWGHSESYYTFTPPPSERRR